ncbi:HGxxPAAW family protein [Streptomyces sp. NPDC051183]|uniref:HGxxPAAW family protein n=1 Tax=unclassified Streptomyces TaxID=2593676 RepID=UPI00343EB40D
MAGTSHGHTPAAWTGVIIAFIGFCVSGAFMVLANPWGFWAGLVVVAIGGVVGMAMRAAGMGAPKATHHDLAEVIAANAAKVPAKV